MDKEICIFCGKEVAESMGEWYHINSAFKGKLILTKTLRIPHNLGYKVCDNPAPL